jgi:autotransporter passenger strand-loop-strand repeat protein
MIDSGGLEVVSAGGVDSAAQISGGEQDVYGSAVSATVFAGSQVVESGGSASGTIINSGGSTYVESGGEIVDTTVESGGFLYVYSGAIDSGTTVDSGGTVVVDDGTMEGSDLDDGTIIFNLTGSDTFSGTLSGDDDLIVEGGGTLVMSGGDAFTGDLTISSGSTLELTSASAAGTGPITFDPSGTDETLQIDGTTMPTNVISGFAPNDTIDLQNVPFDPKSYTLLETSFTSVPGYNVLQIVDGGPYYLYFDPSQNFTGGFKLSEDASGTGTDITFVAGLVGGAYNAGLPIPGSSLTPAAATGYCTFPVSTTATSQGVPQNPYGSVVQIVYTNAEGVVEGEGSGFIINANTIAAHVLTELQDPDSDLYGDQISIYSAEAPEGYNGDLPIFANVPMSDMIPNPAYSGEGEVAQNDFGVIHVPSSVNLASYGVLPIDTSFGGGTVNITGYPGQPPGFGFPDDQNQYATQFSDIGSVTAVNGVLAEQTVVSYPGMSEGPLWIYDGSTAYAVGIVSEGYSIPTNAGDDVQLTPADYQLIQTWENTFPPQVLASACTVTFGQSVSNVTVVNGGDLILAGGTANDTTVSSGGTLDVLSGGIADPTTIYSGGLEVVSAGGTDSGAQISGGEQDVYGSAVSTTVFAGSQVVESGGTAVDTTISGGLIEVLSGATDINGTIYNGVTEIVSSGGIISGAVIAGGTLELADGAPADGAPITFATVLSGGTLKIDGTSMPDNVINAFEAGPQDSIDLAGVSYAGGGSVTELPGGVLQIVEGGQSYDLNFAQFVSGGVYVLSPDGNGGTELTMSSNVAVVNSGQTITGYGVSSGFSLDVAGTAIDTIVASGALEFIESGGTDIDGTINAGASEAVFSGGSVTNLTVDSGGGVALFGGAELEGTLTINARGFLGINSGYTLSNYFVGNGVQLEIGGVAGINGTPLHLGGSFELVSGGAAVDTIIGSGGQMHVNSAGITSGTVVSSGGIELLFAGGTEEAAVVSSGGNLIVNSGGVASDTVVFANGNIGVLSGGTSISATLSGGGESLGFTAFGSNPAQPGGTAIGTIIEAGGGLQVNSGGIASATSIDSGGFEGVNSGGTDFGATVGSGGNLAVNSGGVASDTVVLSNGNNGVFGGGTSISATLSGGGESLGFTAFGSNPAQPGGTASGTIVEAGGGLQVNSGGIASATIIDSGGFEGVASGGTDFGATVNSGGNLAVNSGGVASDTVVLSNGNNGVFSGGTSISATLSGGGESLGFTAFGSNPAQPGGTAIGTIIEAGGGLQVNSGGVASDAVVYSDGSLGVLSGGTSVSATLSGGNEALGFTAFQHLGFGSGVHSCFGAPLARIETQIALTELTRRLKVPRLLEDPPPYRHSPILRGPRHLPLEIAGINPQAS